MELGIIAKFELLHGSLKAEWTWLPWERIWILDTNF